MRGADRKSTALTRKLRRNATDAETKLWLSLRARRLEGFKFVRQFRIGNYVADFVCRERNLIIEVDGGQHAESKPDEVRDARLTALGYTVLRFWNNDVLANPEGVLQKILEKLTQES